MKKKIFGGRGGRGRSWAGRAHETASCFLDQNLVRRTSRLEKYGNQ